MSINLRRLRAFVVVAERRSVTLAAREMGMTPPAVTKGLKELESALGTELFRRTTNGMLLTDAGEAFIPHAQRALAEIEQGREEVALLLGGVGGRIAVGATVEAAVLVLPKAVGRLIERRRQMDISLVGGLFENLSHDVRTGALDFFVGMTPASGTVDNLVTEPIYADELKVVVRPEHPMVGAGDVSLRDLTRYRWVRSANKGPLLALMRRSFEDADVSFPNDAVVVEPLSSMRGLLKGTDLIAAVTSVHMREELTLGQLVELPVALPASRHVVSVIRREDIYVSSSARDLIVLIKAVARELGLAVSPD